METLLVGRTRGGSEATKNGRVREETGDVRAHFQRTASDGKGSAADGGGKADGEEDRDGIGDPRDNPACDLPQT